MYGGEVTPPGDMAGRFAATSTSDRQILADTEAAGARFLITEDVDDFADVDLMALGLSAANPDPFRSVRMTREAYAFAVRILAETRSHPRRSRQQIHAGIAQRHPRLFAAHADLFDIQPEHGIHPEPAAIIRGSRCLRSERIVDDPGTLIDGTSIGLSAEPESPAFCGDRRPGP